MGTGFKESWSCLTDGRDRLLVRVRRVLVDGPGEEAKDEGDEERVWSWNEKRPELVDEPVRELNGPSSLYVGNATLRPS